MQASPRVKQAKTLSVLLMAVLTCVGTAPGGARGEEQPRRPIAAALFAEPASYAGVRIQIYGLVISSDLKSRSFELQDVSQMPLTVDGRSLPPIKTGDQVEIEGVLQVAGKSIVLKGERIQNVRVTGGGGCC